MAKKVMSKKEMSSKEKVKVLRDSLADLWTKDIIGLVKNGKKDLAIFMVEMLGATKAKAKKMVESIS